MDPDGMLMGPDGPICHDEIDHLLRSSPAQSQVGECSVDDDIARSLVFAGCCHDLTTLSLGRALWHREPRERDKQIRQHIKPGRMICLTQHKSEPP
jgi:hypothetical protein